MSCSACAARLQKNIAKTEGVKEVSVNLLTQSMSVLYDEKKINTSGIIKKVEETGYGAALKEIEKTKAAAPQANKKTESNLLKNRLIISVIFTVPLFYLSMGGMLKLPLPPFLTGMENALVYAFTLFLLSLPVIFVNRKYFQNGFKNLIKLSPNMDSLIAIGGGAAFAYGIFAVYKIGFALGHGDMETAHKFMMDLYFESAAMILTLITLGKFLEARAKGKTSEAVTKLMNLTPKTAIIIRDGAELEIAAGEVIAGDILVVKAGAAVPADGIITEGYGSLDEAAVTGESLPVDKKEGGKVTGGTVNLSGYFKMKALAVGKDTALSKIIRLVEEASSSKAPVSKLADIISRIFVPAVIGIALISLAAWLIAGKSFEFALTAAISVLVISCPCALGLATPAAITVGMGIGAQNGILIKSAEALENLHNVNIIALDKTGTVTEGKPSVTDVIPAEGVGKSELLKIAASLEKLSSHPFAAPIVTEAEKAGIVLNEIKNFEIIAGQGVTGTLNETRVYGGNRKLTAAHGIEIKENSHPATHGAPLEMEIYAGGKTPLFFAAGNKYLGAIILADTVKPSSISAIAEFKETWLEVIMLTGDNAETAEAVCKQAGIDKVIAEILPEDKEKEIRKLQENGKKVAMIGDGINDAPSLSRADVGIAIGAGTDIAIESADIVLIKSGLQDAAAAIRLSKKTMRNIKQNLFWAFIYNIIGIPLAAGALYAFTGRLLNPMIAAAAMSFSSISVVLNALRLKLVKIKK